MLTSEHPSTHPSARVFPFSSPTQIEAGHPLHQNKILIVEDHPLVREGILALIRQQPDLICCGEADSFFTTLTYVAVKRPDLVLLDLRLQDGDAFALINVLRLKYPRTAILVLSQSDEKIYAEKAIRSGARGYLMKQNAPLELANAIRAVLAGKVYLSQEMSAEAFHLALDR
jgi:DNA-binding NarL/FixJ family response regulator